MLLFFNDVISVFMDFPKVTITIGLIIYSAGVWISVDDRTTVYGDSYKTHTLFGAPITSVFTSNNDAEPEDVWQAMLWPCRFFWMTCRMFTDIFNNILVFILLIFGYKYKNTKIYEFLKW